MSNLAKRAFSGASATLSWQAARVVLMTLSIVVLARLLSPADYGLIAMVTAVIGIGELLRDFGLSMAALQSKTLTADEKSNLFWLNTLIGGLLTVLTFFASWPIASFYGDDRLVGITQVLALTFLLNGFATQFKAQINRELRFIALGVTEAAPQALALVVAIVIAVTTHSYWALVAHALVIAIVGALLCVGLARWWPGLYRRSVPISRFVRFASPLVGTQLLAYVARNIDSVLLGVLSGPAVLGIYNRAYQIVVLPLNQVTSPLTRVALPVLSRLQDAPEVFMRFLRTAQFATITVASILYGVMIGFGDPLVRIMLGDQWLEAVLVLQILAFSGLFRALTQVSFWTYVALGRTREQLGVALIGRPIIVVAIAVGAVTGGAVGVAAGSSVGYAIFWILNMWMAGRITRLPIGQLAISGIALVGVFALPVAAVGLTAVHVFGHQWTTLVIGGLPTLMLVAAAIYFVPRYRAEFVRFARLARDRKGPADPRQASGLET